MATAVIDELKINIVTNTSGATRSLSNLASKLKQTGKTASTAQKDMEGFAESERQTGEAGEQASRSTEKVAKSVKKAGETARESSGFFSKFFSAIGRIAMYRAIRSAIKGVTQAIREGVSIFVEWDRNYNNGMAGAAGVTDELKKKWEETKAQIGAAIMPIIQSLAPIIEKILNGVKAVFNFIQQVVRALRGEEEWYEAIWVDAKNTTKEAKELKRVLFGFDELNVLPSKNDSGSLFDEGGIRYVKKAIPSWMKLLGTGLGIAGAITGIVLALKNVKGLLEKLVSKLTKKLKVKTDYDEVNDLVDAIGNAKKTAEDLNDFFKDNKYHVTVEIPEFDLVVYRDELDATIKFAKENKIIIENEIKTLDFKDFRKTLTDENKWLRKNPIVANVALNADKLGENISKVMETTQTALDKAPLSVGLTVDTDAINKGFPDVLKKLQTYLNKHPLKISVQVGTEVYGKGNNSNIGEPIGSGNRGKNAGSTSSQFTAGKLGGGYTGSQKVTGKSTTQSVWDWLKNSFKSILGYEQGGIPNVGSLFYAGEGHTEEIVSNINGRTNVLNASQMGDAIAEGNIPVVNAIYAVLNAVNSKDMNVYLDSQKIGQSVTKYQSNQARRGITQIG